MTREMERELLFYFILKRRFIFDLFIHIISVERLLNFKLLRFKHFAFIFLKCWKLFRYVILICEPITYWLKHNILVLFFYY